MWPDYVLVRCKELRDRDVLKRLSVTGLGMALIMLTLVLIVLPLAMATGLKV